MKRIILAVIVGLVTAVVASALAHRAIRGAWPQMDGAWFADRLIYGALMVTVILIVLRKQLRQP